jgi:hypothetical protein
LRGTQPRSVISVLPFLDPSSSVIPLLPTSLALPALPPLSLRQGVRPLPFDVTPPSISSSSSRPRPSLPVAVTVTTAATASTFTLGLVEPPSVDAVLLAVLVGALDGQPGVAAFAAWAAEVWSSGRGGCVSCGFSGLYCPVIYSWTEVVVLTGCRGVLGAAAAEGQADFPAEVLAGHGGFGSIFKLWGTGDDAVDQSDGGGAAGRMLVISLNKVGETRQEKVRLRSETTSFRMCGQMLG